MSGAVDWQKLLDELTAMRVRLDQIAAVVMGRQAVQELMPTWSCGHQHRSRQEAIACKLTSTGAMEATAEERTLAP